MRMYDYIITDPSGLHARPSAIIAKCCSDCNSLVQIECQDKIIDGSDILAIMGLYAKKGDLLSFYVTGEDEDRTIEKIKTELKRMESM
ncbi:MAG: HPr family phosphocarrier protein [Lachnospiraceae bacterium]|nr:HPr family phosphocarrier protein [Lachnospiraceae bacterium]